MPHSIKNKAFFNLSFSKTLNRFTFAKHHFYKENKHKTIILATAIQPTTRIPHLNQVE